MTPSLAAIFRYCPQCGQRVAQEAEGQCFLCPGCDFCYYFNPASAVGAIIEVEEQGILFLRRNREPSKGKLSVPGGFVDPGESVEAALRREVTEEVNLAVQQMDYLCSHPNNYHYRGVTYPVTDLYFTARVESLEPLTPERSEVAAVHFYPLTEETLAQAAFPSLAFALREYLKSDRSKTQ